MGYTHDYRLSKKIEQIQENCLSKIRAVVRDKEWKDYLRFEYDSEKPPVVNEKMIRFNGTEVKGCETFVLSVERETEFCKTNERDYDLPVCITLLILKDSIDGFELGGDGFWIDKSMAKNFKETGIPELGGSWNKALDYVKEKYGIEFEWILNETESGGWKYYKMEICKK